ncbi:MAG: hypothetical protein U0587_15000 [Candidatus Binatia bacterium]
MRFPYPAWCLILTLASALPDTPGQATVGCPGDCNDNGAVTVDELLVGVQMALGQRPLATCPPFDAEGVGQVTVDDLLLSVDAALHGCAVPNPPPAYRPLYSFLQRKLAEMRDYLRANWDGRRSCPTFSTALLVANGNRGEALLPPTTMVGVNITLDRLQSLGVQGVYVSVPYPLFVDGFPHAADYIAFYHQVSQAVHSRSLKMMVSNGTVFPVPAFSSLPVADYYAQLTLDRYKREKRAMVATIVQQMQPEYLTLENEPSTQQANTGLSYSVSNATGIIQFVLDGLDRQGTLMGAGAGTWESTDYVASFAANTTIDYIDAHVYPINRDFVIDRLIQFDAIADANHKRVVIGESWLYKSLDRELGGGVASTPAIFARDVFSFWEPLDREFFQHLTKLADLRGIEWVSLFWMRYFYGFLDYTPSLDALMPAALFEVANQAAAPNIVANRLTPTGFAYKELIDRACR